MRSSCKTAWEGTVETGQLTKVDSEVGFSHSDNSR